jgi:environmental stress-induced protein Ves
MAKPEIKYLIGRSEWPSMPWSNGGGITHELLRLPSSDCRPFAFRISCAEVASDGPFSIFHGIDRLLIPLEGGGLDLESESPGDLHSFAVLNKKLDVISSTTNMFAFPGEQPWYCRRVGGDVLDFNIMLARGIGSVCASIHWPSTSENKEIPATYLFALASGNCNNVQVHQYDLFSINSGFIDTSILTFPCILINYLP